MESLLRASSNFQILRDQCHLQIQLRSFEGFNDTCAKILDTQTEQFKEYDDVESKEEDMSMRGAVMQQGQKKQFLEQWFLSVLVEVVVTSNKQDGQNDPALDS